MSDFVPRCACGQAIGWTRLIRRLPCAACAIRTARAAQARKAQGARR